MVAIDKIFISSIVEGTGPFRQDLISILKKNDFNAETYTFADRVTNSPQNAHDQCLEMINNYDALIGIIDIKPGKNYQGVLLNEFLEKTPECPKRISITAAEILYAKNLGKPTIIMIMPGVLEMMESNLLATITSCFLMYYKNRKIDNLFDSKVNSLEDAMKLVAQTYGFIARKRLKLLGNSMSGPNWNGVDFFDSREVKIRNNLKDNIGALDTLRKCDNVELGIRESRLLWLLNLLNPKGENKLDESDIKFLNSYIQLYTGYSSYSGNAREEAIDEIKARNLLLRLDFGNDEIFCGYKFSRNGNYPVLLKWPNDAKEWSAPGRVEFILYSLLMEIMPPPKLRPIADFNAAQSGSGKGFTAHYSRKPVTVGCQNAANVRLIQNNSNRGIAVEKEMKSMLYLAFTEQRYCLIAVHGKGNEEIDEKLVLMPFVKLIIYQLIQLQ